MTCSALTTCSPETTLLSASVRSEPGGQIGWAAEIQQRLSQGLELIQRQSLDAGDGGLAQGAAATVEQSKGDRCFAERPATGLALGLTFLPALFTALLAAPIQKVLGSSGV